MSNNDIFLTPHSVPEHKPNNILLHGLSSWLWVSGQQDNERPLGLTQLTVTVSERRDIDADV